MSGEQTKRLFAAAWQHEAAATIQRQLKGWRVSTGKSAPNVGWRSNRELEMRNARLLAENRELKQANVALRDINERYNPTKIEAERTKAAEAQRLLQFELGKVRDELQAAKASAALEASKAQAKLHKAPMPRSCGACGGRRVRTHVDDEHDIDEAIRDEERLANLTLKKP